MGHRLSCIATKTGDRGQTSLGSGLRVDKDSPPIETLGAIDELNSWIGFLVASVSDPMVKQVFTFVQHDLFDLGAQISVPGTPLLSLQHLRRIEESFELMNSELGILKEFILPGGAPSAAVIHIARTVCRRAERCLLRLEQIERQVEGFPEPGVNAGLAYLNRLSDLLFVAARIENRASGGKDVMWERGASLSKSRI